MGGDFTRITAQAFYTVQRKRLQITIAQQSAAFEALAEIRRNNCAEMKTPKGSILLRLRRLRSRKAAVGPLSLTRFSLFHKNASLATAQRGFLEGERPPAQGELAADGGVGVLLPDGPEGGGRREHGGGAVLRHDAEEGPGVRRPHRLALMFQGERERQKKK